MNVLVWKSHGDISVYGISTAEKFKAVVYTITECVDGWGLDKQVELVRAHLEKYPEDMKEIRRAFNTMHDGINPAYDNDNFEDLFITKLQ